VSPSPASSPILSSPLLSSSLFSSIWFPGRHRRPRTVHLLSCSLTLGRERESLDSASLVLWTLGRERAPGLFLAPNRIWSLLWNLADMVLVSESVWFRWMRFCLIPLPSPPTPKYQSNWWKFGKWGEIRGSVGIGWKRGFHQIPFHPQTSKALFGSWGRKNQGTTSPPRNSLTTRDTLDGWGKRTHSLLPFGYQKEGNEKERKGDYKIRKWIIIQYKLSHFFHIICCQFQEIKYNVFSQKIMKSRNSK
jgi:hypothetical protein